MQYLRPLGYLVISWLVSMSSAASAQSDEASMFGLDPSVDQVAKLAEGFSFLKRGTSHMKFQLDSIETLLEMSKSVDRSTQKKRDLLRRLSVQRERLTVLVSVFEKSASGLHGLLTEKEAKACTTVGESDCASAKEHLSSFILEAKEISNDLKSLVNQQSELEQAILQL